MYKVISKLRPGEAAYTLRGQRYRGQMDDILGDKYYHEKVYRGGEKELKKFGDHYLKFCIVIKDKGVIWGNFYLYTIYFRLLFWKTLFSFPYRIHFISPLHYYMGQLIRRKNQENFLLFINSILGRKGF